MKNSIIIYLVFAASIIYSQNKPVAGDETNVLTSASSSREKTLVIPELKQSLSETIKISLNPGRTDKFLSSEKFYGIELNIDPGVIDGSKWQISVTKLDIRSQNVSIISKMNIGNNVLNTQSLSNAVSKQFNPGVNMSFSLLTIIF